jgi:plastocyanin
VLRGGIIRITLVVSALVIGGTALAGCGGGHSSAAPAASTSITTTQDIITIQSFAFHPSSLTVTPGAIVSVHNADSTTHTVTASGSAKGAFNTGNVTPNQTTTFTAPTKPGTYPYICNIHQFMMGTLIVS